jgi:Holliday junction resolvase RusA-like endonuclease
MKQGRSHSFVLEGDPVPLARARFGQRRVWDSQSELKICRGIELQRQYTFKTPLSGPLHLEVRFYFEPAKRISRKKIIEKNKNYHAIRPDTDNLIKFICDISNGILFRDDCLVASIKAEKLYDNDRARTEFTLTELVNE